MIGGIHPMMMTPVGGGGLKPQEVFSMTLWTGTSGARSIATGVDLVTNGGLGWLKIRSTAFDNLIFDTMRSTNALRTNTTGAQQDLNYEFSQFTTTGFDLPSGSTFNTSPYTNVAWSFRRAARFFDVVTYTGNGVPGRQIAHALGVAPGMIIVKKISGAASWAVQHRSTGPTQMLQLDATSAAVTISSFWNDTAATATVFTVGDHDRVNTSGANYVAYCIAHDTDPSGIVQCGSYTGNGSASGPAISLGWRPQDLMIKAASTTGDWWMTNKPMTDDARGAGSWGANDSEPYLRANLSNAEQVNDYTQATSTGFNIVSASAAVNASGQTYIFRAIREPIF